jgi:raffinose/stachyose/melibiose transport system permease protein
VKAVVRLLALTKQLPLIAWTGLAIVPFALIILLSFRSNTGIFEHPLGTGGSYDIANYGQAWRGPGSDAGMADYFRNTALAAVAALVVSLSIGSTAAFFIAQMRPKTRRRLLRLFLLGNVVPFVLIIIPLFQFYNAVGALNNPFDLGIAYGVLALPTTVLILTSYYADFPRDLIEAAACDGLGPFSAYVRVALPLSKGAITAVGILVLLFAWGETQLGIILLQTPSSQTVAVGVLGFQGEFVTGYGPIFAGLSIATIPVILLYLGFNRFVRKGIALGGVFR